MTLRWAEAAAWSATFAASAPHSLGGSAGQQTVLEMASETWWTWLRGRSPSILSLMSIPSSRRRPASRAFLVLAAEWWTGLCRLVKTTQEAWQKWRGSTDGADACRSRSEKPPRRLPSQVEVSPGPGGRDGWPCRRPRLSGEPGLRPRGGGWRSGEKLRGQMRRPCPCRRRLRPRTGGGSDCDGRDACRCPSPRRGLRWWSPARRLWCPSPRRGLR